MKYNTIRIAAIDQASHITHGGVFHADEAMATAILSAIKPIALNRTFRVPEDTKALVYDIGGGAYDHHQRGGNGTRENGVPYSSAGLVWRDFGRQIVSCEEAWAFVDQELIAGVDALDNGVYPSVNYPATVASFSSLVSGFNPNWDSEVEPDDAFLEAVSFAQGVLARAIETAGSGDYSAAVRTLAGVRLDLRRPEGGGRPVCGFPEQSWRLQRPGNPGCGRFLRESQAASGGLAGPARWRSAGSERSG